jgi:hypothetical protein
MKYIITEGQLNHLLEVIQTGANNVTIVGSTLTLGSGKYDKSYFVKKPIIIYGGQGKLTLNDLSQLYEIIIKIGEDELKFDMTEYACKNMNITKFGDLQIPAYCVYKDPKNSEDPKNRDIANKIISRQEESKLSGNISSVVGGNVFNKLNSLGSWLEVKEGLNLKEFVNNILSGITNNIQQQDVKDNLKGANILSVYNKISKYEYDRFVKDLYEKKLVYVDDKGNLDPNGKWHHVNKLNTNYSDISDLLFTYLEKAKKAGSGGAEHILKTIDDTTDTEKIKKILKLYRKDFKDLFEKYLDDKKDLMKFTKYTTKFSKIGEEMESMVAQAFEKKGYKILYRGGDGNFIDMIFSVDLIIEKKVGNNTNVITIQVKSSKKDGDTFLQKKNRSAVDYLVYPISYTDFQVIDLKDRKNDFILYK